MTNPVILDNTILTNFALVNRAKLIFQLWPGATCITPTVYDKYQFAVDHQVLPANCWADLQMIELNDAETQLAENLPRNFDPGERTCLALAIHCQGLLVSDDLAARRTPRFLDICKALKRGVGLVLHRPTEPLVCEYLKIRFLTFRATTPTHFDNPFSNFGGDCPPKDPGYWPLACG